MLGPPGSSVGGTSYICWGRTECPDTQGTELLYSGVAAGSHFSETGGGSQYLCLPEDPEFLVITPGVQNLRGYLYGTEYQAEEVNVLNGLLNHNVPCAVCYTAVRGAVVMIPGTSSWTREYYGYLMTMIHFHQRTTFECVDVNAEAIPNSATSTDPNLFYFTESRCNGINCPPYADGNELTCVVCTN